VQRGHEVGFHAGYYAYNDLDRFMVEKTGIENSLGLSLKGGRQHYLRFKVPVTWRIWQEAAFEYDSTVGYADHEGFRCGTCHPFKPYDIENDREIDILEFPLITMDGTLRDYRELSCDEGFNIIMSLAEKCRQVKGTYTILWHNSLGGYYQDWTDLYKRFIDVLSKSKIG